ncbi:MAG: phage terminase large subunit [Phycisphaerales bacterium]|nr:MAG: phage terminase large subunit [Phycisphaerales bacterium]
MTALGFDTKIRGRRHRQNRPTLIVLDDIENEAEVRSAEQRKRKQEWFNRAVLKAGTSMTNVVVVGTVLHYDALLGNLIDPRKSPGWTARKYQAVGNWSARPDLWSQWEAVFGHLECFEGESGPTAARAFFEANRDEMLESTEVLWPELEDYYQLMELRLSEGRAAFDSEKQNEPVNPEDCYFQEADFHYWDDEYSTVESLLASLKGGYSVYGACDPSLGKEGRTGDDSAIVTVVREHATGVLYVLDADIRRRKPDAIIEDVIAFQRTRKFRSFAMETNQFQKFLGDELKRRSAAAGVYIPVKDIHNSTDKLGRIQRLQPLIASGTLRFSKRHITLLEQLRQFPLGAHDDGPDALEMAVSVAGTGRTTFCKPKAIRTIRPSIYDEQWCSKYARRLTGR